tara:strand:- start:867 stop:1058 length:192 start_codon:yes stop_codon:yes gene_type:complete
MIYGFYLIMVIMLPSGEIISEALDWFQDPNSCIEAGFFEEENAPPGVGFVCLEDYVEGDINEK